MNVSITFRHMDPTESLKAYAKDKVSRLQKFLRQPMTARVTLSLEKLEHTVNVQVQSGGLSYEATEISEDTYASIDMVIDKLERQIRQSKGIHAARRRKDVDLRHAEPAIDEVPVALAAGAR